MNTIKLSEIYAINKLSEAIIGAKYRDIHIYKNYIYCTDNINSFKYIVEDSFDIEFTIECDLLKKLAKLYKKNNNTIAKFTITNKNKLKIKIDKTTKTTNLLLNNVNYDIPLLGKSIKSVDLSEVVNIATSTIPAEQFFSSSLFMDIQAKDNIISYSLANQSTIYYREEKTNQEFTLKVPARSIAKLRNIEIFTEFGTCTDNKHVYICNDKVTAYFLLGGIKIVNIRDGAWSSLLLPEHDTIIAIDRKMFVDEAERFVSISEKVDGKVCVIMDKDNSSSKTYIYGENETAEFESITIEKGDEYRIVFDMIKMNNVLKSMKGDKIKLIPRKMLTVFDEENNIIGLMQMREPKWRKDE